MTTVAESVNIWWDFLSQERKNRGISRGKANVYHEVHNEDALENIWNVASGSS